MYSTALQTRCWPTAPRPERPRRRSASAPAARFKGGHLYKSLTKKQQRLCDHLEQKVNQLTVLEILRGEISYLLFMML